MFGGESYLLANPLLHEPLGRKHIKLWLLGHWGTTPPEFAPRAPHIKKAMREKLKRQRCRGLESAPAFDGGSNAEGAAVCYVG